MSCACPAGKTIMAGVTAISATAENACCGPNQTINIDNS